ncbi:MAG TPA: PD-(D/E)XK nuclease family protein [Pyrinomonadaceae bacterium]|nr:PD-(D/E)XK nuclease family protein [Pyrinomonadaceae bacterium]
MNEIWLGPLLNDNRALLIERCAKFLANNQPDAFIYLAASYPLLERVTQQLLDGERTRGVWGELPVYLFRGLVRRVLYSAVDENGQNLPPRIPIDRDELPLKRSLISQLLLQLLANNQLKAFAPLATREGCVNSIATLLGEIQRAARTPAELADILNTRAKDLEKGNGATRGITQLDFDKEISLIYSNYTELLDGNLFTEEDAEQLRALWILRGMIDGHWVKAPWLANVQLLIIDGFFDFTPVQGEILRQLIPLLPQTIVNLNHDDSNPEIFTPFQETIGQFESIAKFDQVHSRDYIATGGTLAELRENLFNPLTSSDEISDDADALVREIRYLECGDRDTEIRTIAREVKRLVLVEKYDLAEIALVVRQRATYGSTITRVMLEEALPCNLELRIDAGDVPANRAALKLFSLLEGLSTEEAQMTRIAEIADLIKSEYFRLSDEEMSVLSSRFDEEHADLLDGNLNLKTRYRIGFWDADSLENAFAYVGSELSVSAWQARAHKLYTDLPGATATKELLNIDAGAHDRDRDIADNVENAEIVKLEDKGVEKKRRPSRDVHPAALAWTALVVQRFSALLQSVPREGKPTQLRSELMRLLDRLGFRDQIAEPAKHSTDEKQLPQVMLNFNALEGLRRAFVAAIKSIELVAGGPRTMRLATFLQEVRRSLTAQSQIFGAPDRNGLRVLEATDVRGLRFRAVFIAGLIEGGFPLSASRDWIYPHEERDRLREYGLTLEDISPNTLLKEEHYFYQCACRATERLYLTRPLILGDDSETVASYYIDELRRAIAPRRLETEIIRRDYDGKNLDDASTTTEMKVGLVRQQERHLHRGTKSSLLPQPRIVRLLTLARNDGFLSEAALRRIDIERERSGLHFGRYDGEITDPDLLHLLKLKFGSDFIHSASSLSVYGNCPYRFFAQRVLRLEPRGEAALDLQAIDAGKLLHDILRRFFERHRREPLHQLDRKKLQKELANIADDVFDEHERVVPPLNRQIWKIDREIRKILLDQVLLYELEVQETAEGRQVLPSYFEVAFGGMKSAAKDPDSKEEPLELTRKTFVGEETIKISGQIDRVDVAKDNTLIAYDYKLSTGSSRSDIISGRSLQLPIYLEALEKLILPDQPIAGGGYYVIRGGQDRRNKGLYRASQLEYLNLRAKNSVFTDEEWQRVREQVTARVWEFLDGIRAGRFIVDPSERLKTCRFCDYSAVCRYDRDRIDRKKAAD